MRADMIRILVTTGHYLPAYKAGGPIRTLQAMIEFLGDEFQFLILTGDRDLGDSEAFPNIHEKAWLTVGKAQVRYLDTADRRFERMCQLVDEIPHDLLYLNSFFDPVFTIQMLLFQRIGLIPRHPTIVAPRGEFASGALGIKTVKKQLFIRAAHILGLYRSVLWQASSIYEAQDIQKRFLGYSQVKKDRILIAPDLALPVKVNQERKAKIAGHLRIIFLSRIAPVKNLEFALNVVRSLQGKIIFDIYGPIGKDTLSQAYWTRCQRHVPILSENMQVAYHGSIQPSGVPEVLAAHDLLFLPTLGENFGHVILEALSVGCPVLISDRTQWRNLPSAKAGWDLSLEKPQAFVQILQEIINMDEAEFNIWRIGACAYAQQFLSDTQNIEKQRQVFSIALRGV